MVVTYIIASIYNVSTMGEYGLQNIICIDIVIISLPIWFLFIQYYITL